MTVDRLVADVQAGPQVDERTQKDEMRAAKWWRYRMPGARDKGWVLAMLAAKRRLRVAPVPRRRLRRSAPLPRAPGCGDRRVSGENPKGETPVIHSRSNKPYTERRDHYQDVTDRIIAALESGTKPWQQPWNDELAGAPAMPVNAATGRRYHGINVLVLAMSSFAFGNGDPRFCSYRQAADRGWQVRKGERGTTVFFFKRMEVVDSSASPGAEERTKRIPMLRAYTVFNGAQLDGIDPYVPPSAAEAPWRRPEAADLILRNSGAMVRIGGERAFYSPTLDFIHLPAEQSFHNPQSWSAVALHELGHWTSAPHRLNRDIKNKFGSEAYAQEELRAELASVFIGATLGLPCDIPNHASYIASWVEGLKRNKREIFRAASDAQKIADYLLAFHPDYVRATASDGDSFHYDAAAGTDAGVAEAA